MLIVFPFGDEIGSVHFVNEYSFINIENKYSIHFYHKILCMSSCHAVRCSLQGPKISESLQQVN